MPYINVIPAAPPSVVGSDLGITIATPPSGDATGVTDTANLQANINAAGGGELWFPPGTWTILPTAGGALTNPSPNKTVRLYGQGPEKTFIGCPVGSSGVMFGMNFSPTIAAFEMEGFNLNMPSGATVTGLQTSGANRMRVENMVYRYGNIGWEHTQVQGQGPVYGNWHLGQNQTGEVFHLTGSSGLGTSGYLGNCYAQVTDAAVAMTQAVLIDWFTTGWTFNTVQALGNNAGGMNIHKGIVYTTAAPTGLQGAFLYFTNCTTDQMDTGNGLDLTNARGIWAQGNFWSVLSTASGTFGINVNAGKEQFYVNDWISGTGIQLTNAPDKITIGSGCRFPQTQTGGAIFLPAANPPTNMIVSSDAFFYGQMTNRVGTLETATRHGFNWTRAGSYV